MDKSLRHICIIGFLFTSVLGTLNHFVYDWFGQNMLIGMFVPISESIWEHIKLLFFPMLLSIIYFHYRYRDEYPAFTIALLWGVLYGSLMIPVLYYTYTGIVGFHNSVIDIAIYYISVFAAFSKAHMLYIAEKRPKNIFAPRLLVLCLFAAFWVFTYFPPKLPLFAAP